MTEERAAEIAEFGMGCALVAAIGLGLVILVAVAVIAVKLAITL